MTSDPEILQFVRGTPLNFVERPVQHRLPHEIVFTTQEQVLVRAELDKFVQQGIIENTELKPGDYCSNLFIRPKKTPGQIRCILSLKRLNKFVKYVHFKMETLQTILLLLKRNMYMSSFDLSQSFYHIKVREQDQKFLKFVSLGQKWVMKCLPMGYRDSPRVFTRLMKVPIHYLRQNLGVLCSYFLDDVITLSESYPQGCKDTAYTGNTLTFCGYHINFDKSATDPAQRRNHLGFLIDSTTMTLHLLDDKAEKIINLAKALLATQGGPVSIRQVAKFVGTCIAACPVLEYGPYHTKELEISKTRALNASGWDFDADMTLTVYDIQDIHWWSSHVRGAFTFINPSPVDIDIYTDASDFGWGGYCQQTGHRASGFFDEQEKLLHINVKELLACHLVVNIFLAEIFHKHIHLHIDNQAALGCLRAQGSTRSPMCNKYTAYIMKFFESHHLHMTVTYIQTSCNTEADRMSRLTVNDDIEWTLRQDIFDKLTDEWGTPEVDLFANRLNHKLPIYMSWHRDPGAIAIDALNSSWQGYKYLYVFCAFSLIPRVINKINRLNHPVQLLMVIPFWPSQLWWIPLMDMIIAPIMILPPVDNILFLPHKPQVKHPLKSLNLVAIKVTSCKLLQQNYQQLLSRQSANLGRVALNSNIRATGADGLFTASRWGKIPFFRLV